MRFQICLMSIGQLLINRRRRIGPLLVLLLIWGGLTPAAQGEEELEAGWQSEARLLLEQMSVEQRVGQLFMVTFAGDNVPANSELISLIHEYKVGGVVLQAGNDNIGSVEDGPLAAARLTNDLQRTALQEPVIVTNGDDILTPTPTRPAPELSLPLLIAINHEGNGYPHTAILNGMTAAPSQMAIGATWQPNYARAVGVIVGEELAAIGVNMLLGPSLDVLENSSIFSQNGLGARSFGSDPYWVGLMGQNYISGVHAGSQNRVATVAKHFPGYGSSDRLLHEEIATVRKSLDQLRQVELAPFFAVTGLTPTPSSQVDGLMATHVRYQGFQGNLRVATAPVSFDPQVLDTLTQLPEIAPWRQQGGVIVSDALGVRAVRRFFDDTEQEFPHRRIARDALLAGNDLLYVSNFAQQEDDYAAHVANVKDTISWFQEKYESDQSFQQRVDEAVLRIIALKLRLYQGDFNPGNVLVNTNEVNKIVGQGNPAMFDLARDAITLISPNPTDLAELLPPADGDRIVIFTDLREVQQCSDCPPQPLIGRHEIEEKMLTLYGPQASGQVRDAFIDSFSLAELADFLAAGPGPIPPPPTIAPTTTPTPDPEGSPTPEGPTPTPLPTPTIPPPFLVQTALQQADWIIFAILDDQAQAGGVQALRQFLAQRPDLARSARVIVFAFDTPYYLDTTEISKLSAYFGVYSKTEPFVSAAVRALFQESPLRGASPVDIEGIGYHLFNVTQPDPRQVIELYVVSDGQLQSPPGEAPLEATPGETLRLQTGVLVDRNGNRVPDGTIVQFIQQDRIQGFISVLGERPTVNGVANLDYLLEARTGQFRITAVSGEARSSQEVDIAIGETAAVSVRPIASPTATPTELPLPAPTATPTLPPPTPIPSPTPEQETEEEAAPLESDALRWQMLLGVISGLAATSGLGVILGRNGRADSATLLRYILWGVIGSLTAYNYFMLNLPGASLLAEWGSLAALITTIGGGAAALIIYTAVRRD